MEVIGVGYGRTGTDSLRVALNQLGYRTFHTKEMFLNPFSIFEPWYDDLFSLPYFTIDPHPPLDDITSLGYTATTDFPLALYVDELLRKYPTAKFILTTHVSSERWYRSWIRHVQHMEIIRNYVPWLPFVDRVEWYTRWIISNLHNGDPSYLGHNHQSSSLSSFAPIQHNKQQVMESYENHNDYVRRHIPSHQLLELSVDQQSWKPLCDFLNKPIPTSTSSSTSTTTPMLPYPHTNSTVQVKMICWTVVIVSNLMLCIAIGLLVRWIIQWLGFGPSNNLDLTSNKQKRRNNRTTQDDSTAVRKTENNNNSSTPFMKSQDSSHSSTLQVEPIGVIRSIYKLCVGTPRQGLLAPAARGKIVLHKLGDTSPTATVDGLEGYNYIWVIFVFHLNNNNNNHNNNNNNKGSSGEGGGNNPQQRKRTTTHNKFKSKISPPALGGQKKVGIFATRSPHRYNPIGITLCKLDRIETTNTTTAKKNNGKNNKGKNKKGNGTDSANNNNNNNKSRETVVLHVSGLDLVDGTPVVDIKPYVPVYDSVNMVSMSPTTTTETSTSNFTTITNEAVTPSSSSSSSSPVVVTLPPPTVPHWVQGGLATTRPVHITDVARAQLHTIMTNDPYALEFYPNTTSDNDNNDDNDNDALQSILDCITQVLAIDVRSSYQTQKVRTGKSQAHRSIRVIQQQSTTKTMTKDKENQNGNSSSVAAAAAADTLAPDSEPPQAPLCTQQLDNLLIHFRVSNRNQQNEQHQQQYNWSPAEHSGAEDIVIVEKIELL